MRTAQILLVEDNPGDIRLTREALKESRIPSQLFVVNDGVEALDFMRKIKKFSGTPMPDLILLDLNLPRKSGIEVLAELKCDKFLSMIPVVVLTTSQSPEDIRNTYSLGANCFICKPVEFDSFTELIRSIENFWFQTVKLPNVMN